MKFMNLRKLTYLTGLCALVIAGCSSKDADETPVTANAPSTDTPLDISGLADAKPAPVYAPPGAPAAPAGDSGTTTIAASEVSEDATQALAQLNSILTGTFLAEIGRPPTSVNEFVERGLIRQLPKAPEGKKFFYDAAKNQIVLANRLPGEVDPAPLTAEQAQRAYMQTAAEIHKRISQ